jgi:peroxiredoxin
MRSVLVSTAAAALIAGAIGVAGIQAVASPAPAAGEVQVPARADNFQLTDHNRMFQELYYYKNAPAVVVMTQSNGSKTSQAAAKEFQKLADAYKAKGVVFLMLNSDVGVTREKVSAEMQKVGVKVPVMVDEQQLVGASLGVKKEAEVFVFEPKTWSIAYHGPLDDRFAKSNVNAKASAKSPYTAQAIDAVIAGQPVKQARVEVKAGKTLAFPDRDRRAEHVNISYSGDVAPILMAKCVTCHAEGGIAPFAMNSYDVVKGFAPMIRESVRTDRMPPYFADPHIGTFKNDQALTAKELKTLVHWIEAGAPRGDGPDILKEKAKPAPEWPERLGKPDYIVELPAFDVPASGIIEYQNFRVPNPFNEDKWLRAVSIKPGSREALHHVVSNHSPDPKIKSKIPGGSVGSYTPGAEAQEMAPDSGAPIPAGGALNFQMHYTSVGKPVTDKTQVGFYFLDAPPKHVKRSAVIGDFALSIPPNEARHTEIAYLEFPADAYLYTLYPHAHYRGTHVELKAVTPDGKEEMLLSLPKYDFNWQRDYDPVKPIHVKAGTKLVAKWVYDNSKSNPANPDPTINVTWGEQTHEEMMYFRVNYRWADETSDNIRNDLQAKLMESRTIGALDDNHDGKVQVEELRGPMARMKANFATMDKNGDGGLDKAELNAGGVSRATARQQEETPDL